MAYVGAYAADNSLNVTVVSGSSRVGKYAADGSMNVVASAGGTPIGLNHASGALNVTSTTSNQTSIHAADGSMYVSVSPYKTGTRRVTVVSGSLSGASNQAANYWFFLLAS